jgi:hypothetical protein
MRLAIDSLVRGTIGQTPDTKREMRIFRVSSHGWVAGIGAEDGKQHIMYPGNFEVVGEPRPVLQRRDIPRRFQ